MKKIEIFGSADELVLSIKLVDIIKFIDNGNQYYWKLFWIEGVSKSHFDMLEFEEKAKQGLDIDFDELLNLDKNLVQLLELLLVGSYEPINELDENLEYDFLIELIDASFWEVSSNNEVFINKLEANLV